MRLGLFVTIFGSVLGVLTLAVPVRLGPLAPRDQLPRLAILPRCFAVTYPSGDSAYMPTTLRLEGAYDPSVAPERTWYLAQASPDSWVEAAWRPWGTDSIDVSSYHGPRIRIPARGDDVAGQIVPTGVGTVFDGLLFWVRRPVHVRRIECRPS